VIYTLVGAFVKTENYLTKLASDFIIQRTIALALWKHRYTGSCLAIEGLVAIIQAI